MTTVLPAYPHIPLKQMDAAMLVFELNRETQQLLPASQENITSAATLAAYLHRHQTRSVRADMKTVPYIEHPLRVALRLLRWGVRDSALVTAALLHDVVEDCATELLALVGNNGEDAGACLRRLYGGDVADHVAQVTNPDPLITSYRDHIVHLAAQGSPSLLIKASDLKDNAGSLRHQLGHDETNNHRMLVRVNKYLAVVAIVADGLRQVSSATHEILVRATSDLLSLEGDLRQLAEVYHLDQV